MTERTAEEAKRNYVEKMGDALGAQFHVLWQEVSWLHIKRTEYVELFGSKPNRVDLLNRAAPAFFSMIQGVFWEDIVLHVARLTDSPKSLGNTNLTIRGLPELVDPTIKETLQGLVDRALNETQFCCDWRNRHIAHRDLELATNKSPRPLAAATRKQLNEALGAIASVRNEVQAHYMDTYTPFEESIGSLGNAVSLLYVLDDGLRAKARRMERRLRADFSEEDSPRDL
ncbi:MAG: hypothetical protein WBD78_12590 [Methylocella sp.]